MLQSLEINSIMEAHDSSDFDCCDADLNDFIKSDALRQRIDGWNTTYIATEIGSKKIIGFFALSIDSIGLTPNERKRLRKDYSNIPAIKIGRFAVDRRFQRKGIGQQMMQYAMGFIVQEICSKIGGIYITLDAYQHRADWYKKHFNYRENTLIPNDGKYFVNLIFPIKDFKVD